MGRKKWSNEKIFFRLLNNKTERTYWDNISELRKRGTLEIFEKAYEFSKSDITREKIIGIDVLAQLGTPKRTYSKKSIKLYFELLKKENNDKVLESLLHAIGHNNNKLTNKQIKSITIYKDSLNKNIREALVFSLLTLEKDIAIDTLIYLMNDKSSWCRDWATFGISSQIDISNEKIIDALWSKINDKNQDIKLEAIVGLTKRKDKRIKDIIIRELKDGEYGTLLFEAIKLLNDKDFLPYLKENLKIGNQENINPNWIKDLKDTIKKLEE